MEESQLSTQLSNIPALTELGSQGVIPDDVIPKADRWSDKFLSAMWKSRTVLEYLVEICEWLINISVFCTRMHLIDISS